MTGIEAAFWGVISGLPLVVGAWVALKFKLPTKLIGMIMGFGAGALIGAIAYELIPDSSTQDLYTFLAFGLGAIVFYLAVSLINRRAARTKPKNASKDTESGISIALGSLLDGIPESLVLGITLATGGAVSVSFLGAVFISNIPEGLSATSDLAKSGEPHRKIYLTWLGILLAIVLFTVLGYMLVLYLPSVDGRIAKAFAAGAVLAMLSDSMIPEGFAEGGRPTGLLVVLGFAVAAVLALIG